MLLLTTTASTDTSRGNRSSCSKTFVTVCCRRAGAVVMVARGHLTATALKRVNRLSIGVGSARCAARRNLLLDVPKTTLGGGISKIKSKCSWRPKLPRRPINCAACTRLSPLRAPRTPCSVLSLIVRTRQALCRCLRPRRCILRLGSASSCSRPCCQASQTPRTHHHLHHPHPRRRRRPRCRRPRRRPSHRPTRRLRPTATTTRPTASAASTATFGLIATATTRRL